MSDPRWGEVEAAFGAALASPPEEREAVLASLCSEESIREEVRRLLARHDSLSSPGAANEFLQGLDPGRAAALMERETTPRTIGRYEVLALVGRGATGAVYLARDPELGRRVAIKLLAPHLSERPEAVRRFSDEARTASALDHPHIATIHEIGRTGEGRLFITMAYYEGETLRARLARGQVPVEEVIRIGTELADALGAAHASGVVHRDVKPENVVLTARGVRLLDFGIAKVTGQEGTPGGRAGTVAYMSPEQARGEPVGPAADLWSLGAVLYEMAAGRRPFRGGSSEQLVASILRDTPEPLRELRPGTPPALARAVERCLEQDPARRYPSAEVLAADLASAVAPRGAGLRRTLAAAGVAALVSAAALTSRWRQPADASGATGAHVTIAVPPFALLGDSASEYLAEGMTAAVMEALSRSPGVRLAGRSSVLRAMDDSLDPRALGTRLGAASLLEGTVAREGDSVRVGLLLIATGAGDTVWSREFRGAADDVLSLQENVGRSVVSVVRARTGAPAAALPPAGTDPVAYDLYLKGRFHMYRGRPEDLEQAIALFREAVARDSGLARAYAGIADVLMTPQPGPPAERYGRAIPLLQRALTIDSTLATAHRSAGWAAMWYDRDWSAAERHFRRALELDPSDVWGYTWYAAYYSATGRTRESLAMTRRAASLDPIGLRTTMHIGLHLYWERRYDEAIAVLRSVQAMDSTFARERGPLALALLASGREEEALAELRRPGLEYGAFEPRALLGYALGRAGHHDEARAIRSEYEARARGAYVSPVNLVAINLGLGEVDRALDWLERVPDDRGVMIYPLSDPIYQPLREHPRFQRVLERLRLAPAPPPSSAASGSSSR